MNCSEGTEIMEPHATQKECYWLRDYLINVSVCNKEYEHKSSYACKDMEVCYVKNLIVFFIYATKISYKSNICRYKNIFCGDSLQTEKLYFLLYLRFRT